ncbi:hypothetical protein LWI29_023251 [Acer saccharum]|uniref:Uncharacterized protein n=1 Tax=Acer saccharum TaxID=4024 RepID=A0AA39S2S9_ACESA|nr:hypothetical protein LWI29_023251 [Acer saccharum]KAK1565624.1 hypothetical protein Q3G72_031116 [Acer saccharum]
MIKHVISGYFSQRNGLQNSDTRDKILDNYAEKVFSSDNPKYGYNAATGIYKDLMAAGIIDPTKVVRSCLEHDFSVEKTS